MELIQAYVIHLQDQSSVLKLSKQLVERRKLLLFHKKLKLQRKTILVSINQLYIFLCAIVNNNTVPVNGTLSNVPVTNTTNVRNIPNPQPTLPPMQVVDDNDYNTTEIIDDSNQIDSESSGKGNLLFINFFSHKFIR